MVYESEPRFLVLHGLHLKGFAGPEALVNASGLPLDEVERHLGDLADQELALRREGRVSGWQLTPAGKARHLDEVAEEIARSGSRRAVEDAYRRFLDVNGDLLRVCTAWQMRDQAGRHVVNDHRDAAYDHEVIDRLGSIHEQVRPVVGDLGATLSRFGGYGRRLGTALDRVVAGDTDWFTKPVIDSYHTVWFELHEDLLSTLSLERSTEAQVG